MLDRFVRDAITYTVPMVVSRGLPFLLIPFYTRVLSPADFGSLDLFMVFATLASLVVTLEVSQGLARMYAGEPDSNRRVAFASTAFWFTVTCYGIFLALAQLAGPSIAATIMGRDDQLLEYRVGVLYVSLNGVLYLVQNQFRWELRSGRYAVISLLVSFVTAASAVVFMARLELGLAGLLWAMVAGTSIGTGYGLWHLRNSIRMAFCTESLREMLRFSAPLVPSGVAVFLTTFFDRIMINTLLSVADVGLYGVAYRVASVVGLVTLGTQAALSPLIFTHFRERTTPPDIARIFRVYVGASLVIVTAVAFFSPNIMRLMAAPAYVASADASAVLVVALLLSHMYVFAPGISIAKKTTLILFINVGGATLNVVLNALAIPAVGIVGAAAATSVAHLSVFCAYMILSQRFYPVPHEWSRLGAAVTVSMIVIAWLRYLALDGFFGFTAHVVALVVITLIISRLGLLTPSDLAQVAGSFRRARLPFAGGQKH